MLPAPQCGYCQPNAGTDNTRASFSTSCWSASSSLYVPVMEHSMRPSAVNKNGHYVCQQEPYRKTCNQFYPQIAPPQTQLSAAEHMHMMHIAAQPSKTNPPYSCSSALTSVASSPLSSSQSEFSSPFDIDFDTFGLLDTDADVTSMNSDIAPGMCRTNSAGMESSGLGFQLIDECGHMPVDPLVSSTTSFAFINSSNFEPEVALTSTASASERLKRRHTSTIPALTPMATTPISTATLCPPMMAPGSDASVFLFAGEHEPNRHSEEFLLHRTSSSDASIIIPCSATIAPTLLSSSSSSPSTMYTPADETEITLLPSEEAVPTLLASPASIATPDIASIFSTESRASATDEEFCDFEENKQSWSILDVVENEKGRAVQEQVVLPRRYPTGPLDVLQRSIERNQSGDAARDESGRTNPVVCETPSQPILIEQTRSPVKSSNFAVILPTTRPEKAKPMIAQFRPCESANTNSTRAKKRRSSARKLRTPSSSKLTAAKTNTDTSRSPAPKRKTSDAGLDERSDLVREPVVKYAAVDNPAFSCSQKPTSSFAIVIKAKGADNTKTQSDSPRCQLYLQDQNKLQKLFAGLALAVGTLAVGLSAKKIFA
ncbi:hypothetical protein LIPSTDRAFT_104721 [Lipomyces starkeyi NRRL Y-11557]|uniref:Uncharacterized protein n=1 Tax=Lipomyces starkeyi NRRL Y-11557 TaxID=675824 RepID=A0A1E3Q7G3_LIPST|nr:hypothetical protein LIPSTDRAFT_104721 [Lipomyces starkeyi NRRL Y-11557]